VPPDACDLEAIIATAELQTRSGRKPDPDRETAVLLKLHRALAIDPRTFFRKLTEAVLELSIADSAGISLLNEESRRFVWPAVAGPFRVYLWEGTPGNFGPCGTVLQRNATQLMLHPERHFTYLKPIQPGLEEVLLVPFHIDGKAVGTIWAVIHEPDRRFEPEDQRLLEVLSNFAASAYRALAQGGSLAPFLTKPVC
jgi:GAF domain-containing protein